MWWLGHPFLDGLCGPRRVVRGHWSWSAERGRQSEVRDDVASGKPRALCRMTSQLAQGLAVLLADFL